MRCPICSEEVRDTDQAERWGPEFAHSTCVTAYNAGKAAERERYAKKPLTRQQIDDVMTQHYPLSSLLREEVDAFEACVRDIERLHGIGA